MDYVTYDVVSALLYMKLEMEKWETALCEPILSSAPLHDITLQPQVGQQSINPRSQYKSSKYVVVKKYWLSTLDIQIFLEFENFAFRLVQGPRSRATLS